MRSIILAVLVTAGIGLAGTVSAAPGGNTALLTAGKDVSGVVKVAEGCGRGWHRNWRGNCVPNRYWRRY